MLRRKRNGSRAIEQRLDALKSDFDALQRDLRGLANGVHDVASDRINGILKNGEELEEWTTESIGSMREVIREQPLAACIVSMGAGALIGALMLRR